MDITVSFYAKPKPQLGGLSGAFFICFFSYNIPCKTTVS